MKTMKNKMAVFYVPLSLCPHFYDTIMVWLQFSILYVLLEEEGRASNAKFYWKFMCLGLSAFLFLENLTLHEFC